MSAKASLVSQISGKVLTPGDEGYEESLKRWASNFEKHAGYVVYAESIEDISKTVGPSVLTSYRRYYGPRKTTSFLPSNVADIRGPAYRLPKEG